MAHKIDLDGAERARQEATAKAIEIDWHGHTYQLPVEQPMEVARHFRKLHDTSEDENPPEGATVGSDGKPVLTLAMLDETYDDGMSVLFCTCEDMPFPDDDHPAPIPLHESTCDWVRFQRTKPSRETKQELIRLLNGAYGNTSGEAPAPHSSRTSGGARSRQTGSGTTSKTSATSGGGRRKPATPAAKKAAAAKKSAATRAAKKAAANPS